MPKENGHFHLENIAYASQRLTIARGEIENDNGSVKLWAVMRKSNFGWNHKEKQRSILEYL